MTDSNAFPVQAIASTALANFVGYNSTIQIFKDSLEHLLKTVLDVLDQFFTNDLIETLKELIREYDENITELAVHLCDKLAENYVNLMGQIDFKDEDDRGETKVLKAANGCLNAINRIIESIGC